MCIRPADAAQAFKTYGSDIRALSDFRMALMSAGCGSYGTLKMAEGARPRISGRYRVALQSGVADVAQIAFRTPEGPEFIAYIAEGYLAPSCRAGTKR